jgi:hypothetical protein
MYAGVMYRRRGRAPAMAMERKRGWSEDGVGKEERHSGPMRNHAARAERIPSGRSFQAMERAAQPAR